MMNYRMGDEIVVKIDRDGIGHDKGIGHLSDESMVIIFGAGERVGEDVQAIITDLFNTDAGSSYLALAKA